MPPAAKKRESSNVVAAARGKSRPSVVKRPSARGGSFWEGFKSIAGAVAIFLVIRTFFIEAFRIPSGSMIPTLLIGDWLFVNKLRYGPHIPFTRINLPGYAEPRRGEVVVFVSPYQADEAAEGRDPQPTLVKRLVATPGDTIHMRAAIFYVNGVAQRQGYAASVNEQGADEIHPLFDWQKEHGLKASRFGAAPAQPTHDNWGPMVVPARRFFMLGDNRYASKDGRYWGFVPRDNIRGRPLFVYYSYDTDAGLDYFRAFTEIRWNRIGHRIR